MGETRGFEVRSSMFSELRTPNFGSRFRRHALWLPTDCFNILLHSPYHRTNPVAHVTPPPKLPSKTMSCGRILPDRTAWSSAIGNDADDVLP